MARPLHIPFALAAFLTAVLGTGSFADELGLAIPAAAGIEAELLADVADGRWNRFSLVEAALIAEGLQSAPEVRSLSSKFLVWKQELHRRGAGTSGAQHRAVTVLELLHQRVLTGQYAAECNELSRTVRRGDFNCITATLAYLELGRSVGLPLTAIQAPGHVRVRLVGEGAIDIEPTCPSWQRPPAAAVNGVAHGHVEATATDGAGKTRLLTDVALVGKVYYNRGIQLLAEGRFPESLAATRTALALDPDDDAARNNLLAAYNNWALACCEQRRYEDASALIIFARKVGPDFVTLAPNDLHIHQKWVLDLCEAHRFAEALEVLEQGHRRRPDAELFDEGRGAVLRWWAQSQESVPTGTEEMD